MFLILPNKACLTKISYSFFATTGSLNPVLWIRIQLAVLDPDPYWECISGSRSMEIDQNLQINLVNPCQPSASGPFPNL
jgi:hypothetical protein